MRRPYLLSLALLLPAACAQAAPTPPFFPNIPAYLQTLDQSTDPADQAIRARIASGPADLARERSLAEKEGIVTRAGQPQQTLPPPDQNAAVLYARLDALRKQKPPYLTMAAEAISLRYTYSPAQLAAIRDTVQSRPDILTLLHGAVAKPQCVFPEDPKPFDFPKEYAGIREDARELRAESTLLAFQSKYAEAAADQELGFRLSVQVTSTPKEIGFLVGGAIDAITVSSLSDILAQAGPNSALDSRVSADILALPPLSLSHALSGEPAEADTVFTTFHHAKPAELAEALQITEALTPPAWFTPAEQAQVDNLLNAAEADYLHQMRQIIPAADNSGTRRTVFAAADARAAAADPIYAISDQLNPVVSAERIMGPSPTLGGLEQQADRITARRLVTAAGAAVLAAKARTGVFPAALPALFADPFTGKPLGYRLESTDGFVVYSVGPTGDFDGGKPGDPPHGPNIVFRYPLAPVPVPPGAL